MCAKVFVFVVWFLFAIVMLIKGIMDNDEIRISGSLAILTAMGIILFR